MSEKDLQKLKSEFIDYQRKKNEEINDLERRIDVKIKGINKIDTNDIIDKDELYQNLQKSLDLVKPFEKEINPRDPRPNLFKPGLRDSNNHLKNLQNHDLHQIKSYLETDHQKQIKTIMDEPLGEILDNAINFLAKSPESFETKYYEAELLLNVYGTDTSTITRLKVYLVALALFIRDDKNAIYAGLSMIFLSIIIYFINIITFK
jgi:tRNA U34 5-carboxymethylaminomethyl modifying GTPase MnmE/TrmE